MVSNTKLVIFLTMTTILGMIGTYAGYNRPAKVEVVEKVTTVDRIVVKKYQKVKTVTKPDGTKIVTETKTDSKTAEKGTEAVAMTPKLPKYSLGLGIVLDPFNPLKRDYSLEAGFRLWKTPFWGKVGLSTNKTLTLGVSVEF